MKKNTPINSEKQTILKDFSGLEAICGHVYTPENIDQVVEILKTANKEKLKVIPIGGRTGTAGGYFGKIDIGIDLKNFSYIRRTPQDTFVVGAGTKTGEFNKYLRALQMAVPMTESPNACIGGAVSMDNPVKPYHESSLVDHIVAITVVSPTGKKIYLRADNEDSLLFYSTIGGEGITGIIIDAEFKPLKLREKVHINLSFKPNNFSFLESFWSSIISSQTENLSIKRGVVFPLGLLQVRAVFEDKNIYVEFQEKVDHAIDLHKNDVHKFEGEIPIGEMIIDQLAEQLGAQFKFFPAISHIDYNDVRLNDLLVEYVKQDKTIGLIKEIEIGPMKVIDGSEYIFNGRIPDSTKIKEIYNPGQEVSILNYGGSNVGGGTHVAFLGNNLEKIKYHMKNLFKILHFNFPNAQVPEHRASFIRGSQIGYMEGEAGLLAKKKLRQALDPNKVIATTAMQDIDQS